MDVDTKVEAEAEIDHSAAAFKISVVSRRPRTSRTSRRPMVRGARALDEGQWMWYFGCRAVS